VLVRDLDSVRTNHTFKSHDYRGLVSNSFLSPQPNRSYTQTRSHRNDIKGKSFEHDNKKKGLEFPKVSSTIKYYKYQGYRHLTVNCPSLDKITIMDGTPTKDTVSLWRVHLWPWDVETDEKFTSDDVDLNCINKTLSIHLSIVRCVLSQPAEKDEWRKIATFHTFAKIRYKNCKMIVDNGTCINTISSKLLENLRSEVVPTLTIQSVLDWLHDTWGQTIISYPSQFQSLQWQYEMCDHHECGSSQIT